MADGIIDLGDAPQRIVAVPNPRRRRDEIGAERGELRRLLGGLDVPGDARHHEDLRPPGDKISILIDCVDSAFGVRPERHIVGAELGQLHGVVAAQGRSRAPMFALSPRSLRAGDIGVGIGVEMHAVGAEPFGKLGIVAR